MKGCANWRDAIADCALGMVQGPAFAEHLAGCPGCAEALRESLAAATRMNAVLDRRALVEPPSYGADRVMARIAGRNPARPGLWWRWALVACVTVVLIVSVLWVQRPMPQPACRPWPPGIRRLRPCYNRRLRRHGPQCRG